jgi:hypothetical protein
MGLTAMLLAVLKSFGRGIWKTLVRTGEIRGARALANSKHGVYPY